jgi:hypothetical protein
MGMAPATRRSGVVAMITGGIMLLVALVSVAVAEGVSPLTLTAAGVGLLLFVVGALLHDQGIHRPPPGSNYPRIGQDPGG